MRISKYKFIPVLVPSTREDALIRRVNGQMLFNTSPSNKWPLYDVCIVSDMPFSSSFNSVLSTTMLILDKNRNHDERSMVIVASNIKDLGVPLLEETFLNRLVKDYNKKKSIDEVQIEITGVVCKVLRVCYKDINWLRKDYSSDSISHTELKIFPHHKNNTNGSK